MANPWMRAYLPDNMIVFYSGLLRETIVLPGKDRSYISDFLSSPIPFGSDDRDSKMAVRPSGGFRGSLEHDR
jgi:hypothetical protein